MSGIFVPAAIDGLLAALAIGDGQNLLDILTAGDESMMQQTQRLRQRYSIWIDVNADQLSGPECSRQLQGCQPDRSQAHHKNGVGSADADPLKSLIHRTEAACNLSSVCIAQFVW